MAHQVCTKTSKDGDGDAIVSGTKPQLLINGQEVAVVGSKSSDGDTVLSGSTRLTVGGIPVAFVGCTIEDGLMTTGQPKLTVSS